MGIAKTTLLRYQNTLIKFGLIKNITRGKSATGHYRNNIYQITSLEELAGHPDPGKIIDFLSSKMKPDRYQNDTNVGSNLKLSLVSNRYPNNNNINNTNTTTKEGKDAVAAVDFKKLKEEGEEKMRVIKERLRDLDFEGKFIEQLVKDFNPKKIEEKLDLLMERRNIQNPAGWLIAALKNDYQDPEQEAQPPRIDSRFRGNDINTPKQVSREKALEAIKLIQKNISNCTSVRKDPQTKNRKLKTENHFRLKGENQCPN